MSKPLHAFRGTLCLGGGIAVVCSLLFSAPAMADNASVSAEASTIFRQGQSLDKKELYPAYEYLRLTARELGKDGALSFHFGGWGRVDLGDKTNDKNIDGDLQYGYISYQGKQNNLLINAGRQFVTEGVASERMDGIYLRNDFAAGIGAAAFVGAPVVTEPSAKGGDLVYGGRITQGMPKYYTIGFSALKSDSGGERFREEEGVDIWLHPLKQVDVVGRSSYNSITKGWMEHAYSVSYTPSESLKVGAELSNINYRDYFFNMTTNVFSLFNPTTNPTGIIDPNENVLALGGSVAFTPMKGLTFAADYKNYNYEIAKSANYYGVKATYSLPEEFAAGFSVHRMDGEVSRLRYKEIRLFASKRVARLDLAADLINIEYDNSINNVKNAYTVAGAASYGITGNLRVGADIDYSKNPDFDNEVKGLIKLTYMFDTKHAAEGGAKSEKY